MKTIGINDTGEVVKSWDDLSGIPTDKLIKLRDVCRDHLNETYKEYMEARDHSLAIRMELAKRNQ